MKIYMIGQKCIPSNQGGVERHVEELSKRLAFKGHDVFVYCRDRYISKENREHEGVKLISLPTIYTKHLEAIVHTFLATIDVLRRDADIIHYHAIGPSSLLWIPRLLKRKSRIIFTYHCQDYKHQKWGLFARLYLKIGELIGCKCAHQTISVSKGLKAYAEKNYEVDSGYIPNGVTMMDQSSDLSVLDTFGVKKGEYILSVSRLIKHKGIHYLIDAYNKLNTTKKLVIVGDSAYTDDYKELLHDKAGFNENIIFTGELKGLDLSVLLHNAFCFVQPSEAEGLSIALLEAMQAGRCCVVSDIDENKEVVCDFGIEFQSKNIDDLAMKLKYCLDNPEKVLSLGSLSQKRVMAHYHWDKVADSVERVYILNDKMNQCHYDHICS